MKKNQRILLYGNSVILGSIAACLRRCPQFEVVTLATAQDSQAIDTVKPDIVLFDLETPRTEAPFSLLETQSDLLLIGISPGTNLVRVWNSRQLREMSMQGLIALIKGEAAANSDTLAEQTVLKQAGSGRDVEAGF